jgi:hypothetical protein
VDSHDRERNRRLARYEDLNDARRLSKDPTFRLIGSEKIGDRVAALPSRLHWLEPRSRLPKIQHGSSSTDARRTLILRGELGGIPGSVIVRNGEVNYALREAML